MREFSKKRCALWRTLLCAFCVAVALFGVIGVVSAESTASIYGSAVSAEKGDTVTVSFSVSQNPGIWGAKGAISYDAAVLTLKSVEAGNVFTAGEIIMGENMSQNPFAFVATRNALDDQTSNGTLIRATFAVKSDAPLGDYAVKIQISQLINVAGDDVAVSTSSGKISVVKCMHRNTYIKDEVKATETTEGYSGDTYCKNCNILVKKGSVTPVYINTCEHLNQKETVTKEPTCEEAGELKITCEDCEKEEIKEIPATGHEETELTDMKAATTTEEGYTGNTRCRACQKVLTEGEVIPKIPILVFDMVTRSDDTYYRNAPADLIFVSSAQFNTFVRVELDGNVLDETAYVVESGSTKVTLKADYIETLADGKHTITIVSDAGTASAQFSIAQKPLVSNKILLLIAIIAVAVTVVCVGFVVVLSIMSLKKNKEGMVDTDEK